MGDINKISSTESEVSPDEDKELSELLENAIGDFDKVAKAEEAKSDAKAKEEAQVKPTPPDTLWTEPLLKNSSGLSDQFASLFSPGPDGTFSMEQLGAELNRIAEASTQNAGFESSPDAEFSSIIADTLRNLSEGADNIQNPFSDENFTNLMRSACSDPNAEQDVGELLPFMESMMQKLLSKEVLKPALSQLTEKYPPWLDENRSKLSAEDLARYEKQLSILQQVCAELDAEIPEDSESDKKKSFEKVIILMTAMQDCGMPPEELTGDTGTDEPGLPNMQACCIQ